MISSTSVTTSSASRTSGDDPNDVDPLTGPLLGLPGAGPVTAKRLAAQGLETVRDLLWRVPRGYDDLRRETPLDALADVPDGRVVLVRGLVRRVHVFPRRLLDVVVEGGGATLRARWFRPPPAHGLGGFGNEGTPTGSAAPPLYLVFDNQKYRIDKDQFIIGRGSKSSDLPIKDGNISRKHAAVIRRNGTYFIKDLGSTNGIDFKGMRIDNKRIDEGDLFHLCDYELRFTYKR